MTFLEENKMFHKWNMWFHLQQILYIVTSEVLDFYYFFIKMSYWFHSGGKTFHVALIVSVLKVIVSM